MKKLFAVTLLLSLASCATFPHRDRDGWRDRDDSRREERRDRDRDDRNERSSDRWQNRN